MQTFHQYVMRYRGTKQQTEEQKLAEWIFHDHDFPKHSYSYDEISRYLEWNIPFTNAVSIFDQLWDDYLETR